MMIYQMSAFNDDNTQVVSECILSGIVFFGGDDGEITIKGNWLQLYGHPSFSGTATLKKQTKDMIACSRS